jgi:hypothetical protein
MTRRLAVVLLAMTASACASLGAFRGLIQAPRFEEAPGQPAEFRLLGPSISNPLGGASVRIWTRVTNPNPFGFTLSTLRGHVFLEDAEAAEFDLPLGLPLSAGAENVFAIDATISFAEIPRLATVLRGATGGGLEYRLDGIVGVDAGRFGTPTFGPMTLMRGEVRRR